MTLPKIIIIGGIVTAVAVGGYLVWNNSPERQSAEGSLLNEYQAFLEDIDDPKTIVDLTANCDNAENFAEQIKSLEAKADALKIKKNNLKTDNTPTPNVIVNDGSQPLELSDGDYSDRIIKEGSQPLEMSDWDGLKPLLPENKPGSEPLELSDGDYSDRIIEDGSQPLELSDGDYTTVLDKINIIEEEINSKLNNLKTLCDKEKKPKEVSGKCEDACKKYSECTHYTEDTTPADWQDAYDSCMIECADWSDKTKICINKQAIKSVDDCTNLSMCALAEYKDVLK